MKCCAWLLVLGSLLFGNAAMSVSMQPTSTLLDAHLQQAEQLALMAPQDTLPWVQALQRDMLARAQAWEERLRPHEAAVSLLHGSPSAVLQRAAAMRHDAAQTQAWLATDASLAVVLALVAQRSPDVQSAWANVRAMISRFGQAAYLEELLSQFRAFVREVDTKVGPQTHKEMPEKTFAWPSLLALKGEIVDAEVEIAALRYQRLLRQTLNEAARTYFDAQYAQQAVHILQESHVLFTQVQALANERLGVGQVTQGDMLKIQAERAMVETQLVNIEQQRRNALARLNATLLLPAMAPWAPLPSTDLHDAAFSLEHVLTQVRSTNQEALIAIREETLMDLMLRMAESDVLPRASQGYSQFAPGLGAEAGPTRSMLAAFPERPEVSVNRASFGANAAYLEELRIRLSQARDMQRAALAQAELNAKDAHFRVDVARRERQTLAEVVLPAARLTLYNVRANYDTARVPFHDYLEAARSYLKETLAVARARAEHNQMLVELQDRLGLTAAPLLPMSQ